MADQSDGAIVKIVEKYGKDAPKYVEEYVKEMVHFRAYRVQAFPNLQSF